MCDEEDACAKEDVQVPLTTAKTTKIETNINSTFFSSTIEESKFDTTFDSIVQKNHRRAMTEIKVKEEAKGENV